MKRVRKFKALVYNPCTKEEKFKDLLEIVEHPTHNIKMNFDIDDDCPSMSKLTKAIIQYTEYNDSEDVEIYEDDIFDWGKHSRGIVKVVKGQWVFSNENGNFSVHGYCKDGKVVGNISTHPELLEHEDLKKTIIARNC